LGGIGLFFCFRVLGVVGSSGKVIESQEKAVVLVVLVLFEIRFLFSRLKGIFLFAALLVVPCTKILFIVVDGCMFQEKGKASFNLSVWN
jgi:hypothetical protein